MSLPVYRDQTLSPTDLNSMDKTEIPERESDEGRVVLRQNQAMRFQL